MAGTFSRGSKGTGENPITGYFGRPKSGESTRFASAPQPDAHAVSKASPSSKSHVPWTSSAGKIVLAEPVRAVGKRVEDAVDVHQEQRLRPGQR